MAEHERGNAHSRVRQSYLPTRHPRRRTDRPVGRGTPARSLCRYRRGGNSGSDAERGGVLLRRVAQLPGTVRARRRLVQRAAAGRGARGLQPSPRPRRLLPRVLRGIPRARPGDAGTRGPRRGRRPPGDGARHVSAGCHLPRPGAVLRARLGDAHPSAGGARVPGDGELLCGGGEAFLARVPAGRDPARAPDLARLAAHPAGSARPPADDHPQQRQRRPERRPVRRGRNGGGAARLERAHLRGPRTGRQPVPAQHPLPSRLGEDDHADRDVAAAPARGRSPSDHPVRLKFRRLPRAARGRI